MMFAQANSEHCRHKIFNADWIIDGERQRQDAVRHDPQHAPAQPAGRALGVPRQCRGDRRLAGPALVRASRAAAASRRADEPIDILMKVETHNHPTAISPFPGAATGSGGEIRDEGATGRGAKPKAGLVGFSVSNLRIPGYAQPWEAGFRQARAHRQCAADHARRARSAPRRSTTNSAGRTSTAISARSSSASQRQGARRCAAITSRS